MGLIWYIEFLLIPFDEWPLPLFAGSPARSLSGWKKRKSFQLSPEKKKLPVVSRIRTWGRVPVWLRRSGAGGTCFGPTPALPSALSRAQLSPRLRALGRESACWGWDRPCWHRASALSGLLREVHSPTLFTFTATCFHTSSCCFSYSVCLCGIMPFGSSALFFVGWG